ITAFLFLVACTSQTAYDLETENEIVVGLEAAYAPFNWMETTASEYNYPIYGDSRFVVGYDVQVAKEIAKQLNKTLVIKAIEWDGLITALKTGEIDLIIAGMSPTETRKEQIAFTNAYYKSEVVMVVDAEGNYKNATSISDFSGAKVVAQLNTIYEDLINQIPGVIKNQALGSYGELTLAVKNKVADAFVAELPVALSVISTNPSLKIIELVDGGFETEEADIVVSIGARLIDTELVDAINTVLESISEEQRQAWMLEAITLSE